MARSVHRFRVGYCVFTPNSVRLGFLRESRPANTPLGNTSTKVYLAAHHLRDRGRLLRWLGKRMALDASYVPLRGVFLCDRCGSLTIKQRKVSHVAALEGITRALSGLNTTVVTTELLRQCNQAVGGVAQLCESQANIVAVIAKHGASRQRLMEEYKALLAAGGNRTVGPYQLAALALSNPATVDYLLNSASLSGGQKLAEIEGFLLGGRLIYVSGPIEMYDKAELGEEVEPTPQAPPSKQTISLGADKTAKHSRRFLHRLIIGLRWAYNYKQLPGFAGDGHFADLLEVAADTARLARETFGEDHARTLQFLALAQKEHGYYTQALSTLEKSYDICSKKWERLGNYKSFLTERTQMLLDQAEALRQISEVQLLMGDVFGAQQNAEQAFSLSDKARTTVTLDPDVHNALEQCTI